jgi:hypothetical protein
LKEEILHDSTDMKKHWVKVRCNGMKRPVVRTGKLGDWIYRCMAIEKKIFKKTNSESMGFSLLEDKAILEGGGGGKR